MTYEKPKYATDDRSWRRADPEQRKIRELSVKYSDYLFSFLGVWGVGSGAGRIVVSVDKDRPPDQCDVVDKIPRQLEGCEVHVEEAERPKLMGHRRTRHHLVQGGLKVARYLAARPRNTVGECLGV